MHNDPPANQTFESRDKPLQPGHVTRSPGKFFVLVLALSIPIWLMEPGDWPITAAVGVPLMAALILAYREEGLDGLKNLLGRIFDYRRIKRSWYVPIVFLAPVLSLLSYIVLRAIGLPLHAESSNLLLTIPLLFALFFVLGICEEVGWTGYATDPLQARFGALTTGLILGAATALWHYTPLIRMGHTAMWIAWWTVWSVPLRVLAIWLYNNTQRSLFAVIVFHAMVNLSSSSPFIPRHGSHWDMVVLGGISAIAAAAVAFLSGPGTLVKDSSTRA